MNKTVQISLKSLAFILLLSLCVSIGAIFALKMPSIQTKITHRASEWLSKKLGGQITIGKTSIKWFDEIVFEEINIKDLKGRDMIYVKELFVDCKTNFSFNPKDIIAFDNNLDKVILTKPIVKLVMEPSGDLNIDDWIAAINKLTEDKSGNKNPKPIPPFTIDHALVKDGSVKYDVPGTPLTASNLFDYNHFKFEHINGDLSKVFILDDTVSFKAKTVNAVDLRTKLTIKNIKTDFLYSYSAMFLDHLSAKINNSYIGNSLRFYYARPSAFNDFFNKVNMKGNLKDCVLDAQDLGRFAPEMYGYHEKYKLDSKMYGKFVAIDFKDFDLKFGQNSYLKGSATFKGFPDLLKTHTDLKLVSGELNQQDCKQYSANNEYQKYISKINNLKFSGDFLGTYDNFLSNINLFSNSLGKISGKVNVKLANVRENSSYFGDLNVQDFNLGKLVDQEQHLGKISFNGKIKGHGFDVNAASLNLDGLVSKIRFNNYDFQKIRVDGILGKSVFDGNIQIIDPNLQANINGIVDFKNSLNSFKIKGLINDAKLDKLGLIAENIEIKSNFDFDFVGNKLDDWQGRAQFLNAQFVQDNRILNIDSLQVNSFSDGLTRKYTLNSEFFNGQIKGTYLPSQLINDVMTMVKEYNLFFNTPENTRNEYYANKKTNTNQTRAVYELNFKNSKRFFGFFQPEIYASPGSKIVGYFNSQSNFESNVKANFDTLRFGNNAFYKTVIEVKSKKGIFNPEVNAILIANSEHQKLADQVLTQNAALNANWTNAKKIICNANILQLDTKSYANLFGTIELDDDSWKLKIEPSLSNLVLMNNKWLISDNNFIVGKSNHFNFNNLKFSNNAQEVSWNGIVSENPQESGILNIKNFDIETLKPFTNTNLKGIANGQLELKDAYKKPYFASQLNIENFQFENSLIGNIGTEGVWDNLNNHLNIKANIVRTGKEILLLNGIYNPEIEQNPLYLKTKVKDLDLNMFEGLLTDVFSEIKGQAQGDFIITGKPLAPIIEGDMNLLKGGLKINSTGGMLFFDDKIACTKNRFTFNNFQLTDAESNGHVAEVNGQIFKDKNDDYNFDLHANLKDKAGFKMLNTKLSDNEDFYGVALANGEVDIEGMIDNVNISGNLISRKGTKITIPMDSKKKIDVKQEGIPFLVSKRIENLVEEKPNKINTGGVNLGFNLTFTPDAECEIIFDRTNNDVLDVFGDGKLSINYDSKGEFLLNGSYLVRSGKYNFSLQNLASLRKFSIIDGSRITWSGDPYEGILDLKAAYTTNIPISKISTSTTTIDANTRYPVNIIVSLSDRLMTPNIKYDVSFDLKQIPMAAQTNILAFEQKLRNDEQLLSRNVSSILIFSEIFPDNIADALTQQLLIDNVSNMLSNQIGNLANKLNPNLEFGVKFGDFKQNVLNNMQLNFSLKFLNNRAKLSGKSAFLNTLDNGLNSTAAYQNQLTVGGELEYLLSPNGEFKFKLYSRSVPSNYYLASTSGNVIVSGGNFIISRNFNSFFRKPESSQNITGPLFNTISLKDSLKSNSTIQ